MAVDELARRLAELFGELLERERKIIKDAADRRRNELTRKIKERESALACESELESMYERYIAGLSADQRPNSNLQVWRMFADWEEKFKSELGELKRNLAELNNRPIDKAGIFSTAREEVLHLLCQEARAAGLWPIDHGEDEPPSGPNRKPKTGPKGNENLRDYLIPVIRLMRDGRIHKEAFRIVAEELKVKETTVASQCTRMLGLNTQQFVECVCNGRIIQVIKNRYSNRDQIDLIDRELVPLYRKHL